MIDTGDKRADEQLKVYEEQLQEVVAKALLGAIGRRELENELTRLSEANTLTMFLLAGGDVSNPRAQKWIEGQNEIHKRSARKLANDVMSGKYRVDA